MPLTHSKTPRYEALIIRVSLTLLLIIGIIAAFGSVFVSQHGSPLHALLRLAIPATVIASCMVAFVLVRHGRARSGVALVLVASYLSIMVYVVVGGYGLHSYLFGLFALIIIVTSLLIGRSAGVAATLMALVTVLALYALQHHGHVTDADAVRTIPLPNILTVYCILFLSVGAVQYVYSRVFQDMLLAAAEQETRFRQIIEATPLGQVVHRDGRVLMINSVAAQRAGSTSEQLTGIELINFIDPAQHEGFNADMVAARNAPPGQSISAEYRIVGGGQARLFEALTSPVDFVDGPALLTVLRDVTGERAASAALSAAKSEAESASRAKTQFLANMSHEIRTPMNAVLGLSELLAGSGLSGTPLHYARTIHHSASTLLGLINDLLDVARIEEGHFALDARTNVVATLFDGIRDTLQPLADAKRLTLDVSLDAALPILVKADAPRLRQIVLNLAGNAIKFTERGRVSIEVHVMPPATPVMATATAASAIASTATAASAPAGTGNAGLCLRVVDSGIGIGAEQLPRLFERFVQADASETRRHGGSGLGLYIVRELVEHMGGTVTVKSVPGLGSAFKVILPLVLPSAAEIARFHAQAPDAPPTPAAPQPARGSTGTDALDASGAQLAPELPLAAGSGARTILLVEDNEINRMVARGMLETAGYCVIEAVDGKEALALHAAGRFDCILMDLQMPVMGGLDATREIRTREAAQRAAAPDPHTAPLPRVPIIALTANAMLGDRERCLAAGMDDFLTKPFERAALLALLDRIAGAQAQRAQPLARGRAAMQLAGTGVDTAPVFDAQALDGLIRLDTQSPGLLRELVTRLLPSALALLDQIDQIAAHNETDAGAQIALAAHTLRGLCARFGAVQTALLAACAEESAHAGDIEGALRFAVQSRSALARFEPEFRQHPAIAAVSEPAAVPALDHHHDGKGKS